MHVYGQLLNAQLENSVGNPAAGGTPTGRVYIDITNPANAIPRFYNGSNWAPLLSQMSPYSQNATTATTTVNWNNGLYQQVILAAHTIISFTNPVAGQNHVLIVSQRETSLASTTPYMYSFDLGNQDSRRENYLPVGVLHSSENKLWAWFYQNGIRPAYITIPASVGNPGALPGTAVSNLAIHPKNKLVSYGQTSSPYLQTYGIFDGGSKFKYGNQSYVTPQTAAAAVVALSYSPDGDALFVASGSSPYIQGWLVDDDGTSAGTVFSNPGTTPTGAGKCIAVHPSGSHVVIGHTTTPFMSCYPINSGAYGTKVANPVTLPAAQVNAVAWSPVGDYLAVGSQTTPFIQVWPFDPFTGFGTIVTAPVTTPAGGPPGAVGKGISWHPNGAYIAMGMNASPYVTVYPFNRATGAFGSPLVPAGGNIPGGTPNSVQWSPCGNYLIVGTTASSYLYVYDWTASNTLNNLTTFDGSNPGVAVNDITIHPNDEYMILSLASSPYIMTYPMPRKARSYLRLFS